MKLCLGSTASVYNYNLEADGALGMLVVGGFFHAQYPFSDKQGPSRTNRLQTSSNFFHGLMIIMVFLNNNIGASSDCLCLVGPAK